MPVRQDVQTRTDNNRCYTSGSLQAIESGRSMPYAGRNPEPLHLLSIFHADGPIYPRPRASDDPNERRTWHANAAIRRHHTAGELAVRPPRAIGESFGRTKSPARRE